MNELLEGQNQGGKTTTAPNRMVVILAKSLQVTCICI